MHDAVALELAQRLREHLRRNTAQAAFELVGTARAILQRAEDQHRPLAADQREDAL